MDALLCLEADFRREGAEAGFKRGSDIGQAEGRATGFAEGAARGMERQFCLGVAHAVIALGEAHPELLSVRARTSARVLAKLASEHEMHETGNERARDIEHERETLRHQLRLTLALARLPPIRAPTLQGAAGGGALSF